MTAKSNGGNYPIGVMAYGPIEIADSHLDISGQTIGLYGFEKIVLESVEGRLSANNRSIFSAADLAITGDTSLDLFGGASGAHSFRVVPGKTGKVEVKTGKAPATATHYTGSPFAQPTNLTNYMNYRFIQIKPPAPAAPAAPSVPHTGDETPLLLWAVLLMISGLGMVALKKRRFN